MNKIIATDLDGTLFYPKDHRNIICKQNLYFVQSFIDHGGKLIIVSGRSLSYGLKVKEVINRNIDIVPYNGACIYQNNQLVYSKNISNNEVESIINDLFSSYKLMAIVLFTNDGIFLRLRKDSKFFRFCAKFYFKSQRALAEDVHIEKEEYQKALKEKEIYKVLVLFGLSNKSKKRALEANKVIRNSYENVESSWSSFCVEITSKGCSKGNAIKRYCELNNINKDEVYVVGDSGNDISMFKEFHEHSFAMSHAAKTVKKYAKYNLDKYEDLTRYIYEK